MRISTPRSVGVWAAAMTAICVVAACGSGSSSKKDNSNSKIGQSVTIGVGALPPSQGNPFGATYAGPSGEVWTAIFDALTSAAPSGPKPALATSWKLVSPTVWEFQLRHGVKFSDGEPFDADAAKATFDYLVSSAGKATAIGGVYQNIASAKAVSSYVLDITTKTPDPILPRELVEANIVAPKAWASLGPAKFATAPVGTGPYQVKSWGATSVQLTQFEGSWRHSHFKTLTFTQIANGTSRYQALQSGQIQVDYDLTLEQLTSIGSQRDLTLLSQPSGKVLAIQYVKKAGSPLMSAKVRQALSFAVNRTANTKAIFSDLTTPAYQGASPGDGGYDSTLGPIEFDPGKAKSLLAEAGYPQGFSIEVDVAPGQVAGDTEMYEAVKADLAKVGVTANFVVLPFPTWLADFLGAKFPGQAASVAYSDAPFFDAAQALTKGSCLEKPAVLWCQEDQAAVIAKINSTTDLAARDKLFQQVHQMQRTNPPALFLFNILDSAGVSKRVHADYLPIGAINFDTLAPA